MLQILRMVRGNHLVRQAITSTIKNSLKPSVVEKGGGVLGVFNFKMYRFVYFVQRRSSLECVIARYAAIFESFVANPRRHKISSKKCAFSY